MSSKARYCGNLGNGNGEIEGFGSGNLPEWFLIELLTRLPVKYVFKFKCVSKQWLAVISDPSFPRFYIARASSLSQPRPWAILSHRVKVKGSAILHDPDLKVLGNMYSDGFKCPDCYVFALPHSQEALGNSYNIVAVSNGLLLYGWCHHSPKRMNHIAKYYICNPVTKKWFSLPPPKHSFKWVSNGFITQFEGGTLTSFKVVRLDCASCENNVLKFETFSSEIGQWMDFTVYSDHSLEVAWTRMPVAFNGNLHWIDCEHGIVVYDPVGNPDRFRILALPSDIDEEHNDSRFYWSPYLCIHEGRLKYFERFTSAQLQGYPLFSIWMLDDYSTGDWHLLHRVNPSDSLLGDILQNKRFYPIQVYFHPFDADIVFLGFGKIITAYNIKTKSLEHLVDFETEELGNLFSSWYDIILVLPLWPISIPSSLFIGADD